MDEFGLINIACPDLSGNGRFYSLSRINFGKPEIARMLSPDNYVQAPDFTQNFNRYSYCLNNPLKYTDPSGNNYVSDMYHGNNGGGSYFIGFGSTNMSRHLGNHLNFLPYNDNSNGPTYVTNGQGKGVWVDSKDYLTVKDAAEYLASIGIKSFSDLINNINGGKNKKEGEDGEGLPDWNNLTEAQKAQYLLEAGAGSSTKIINVHDVFSNFSPISRDGMNEGFSMKQPQTILLGDNNYTVWMSIYINANKYGQFSPIIDMDINDARDITTVFGSGIKYNYGQRTQFYFILYGNESTRRSFEGWYYGK